MFPASPKSSGLQANTIVAPGADTAQKQVFVPLF